mmetsp:Transcript_47616/g.70894  ORF Transcript_47616/g.70894 Transcript_47616/m.70894 type:complete len:226 (-) Transcript_47616:1096-1773(-)
MSEGSPRSPRLLLGVTGSVAAVKSPEIAVRLHKELRCDVIVLLTRGGENFWNKAKDYDPKNWMLLQDMVERKDDAGLLEIQTSDDEWKEWNQLGDPVKHIDLRDWADIVLVAPLSAHTLAKLSHGLCDDTLSCVLRAWDMGRHPTRPAKPCIMAPAMNTAMWDHPLTSKQLAEVRTFWKDQNSCSVLQPQVKELACGEVGSGALASVDNILKEVKRMIDQLQMRE